MFLTKPSPLHQKENISDGKKTKATDRGSRLAPGKIVQSERLVDRGARLTKERKKLISSTNYYGCLILGISYYY